MSDEEKIGIIIVMHKQKHNLERLYSSLSKQTFKYFMIYFVDNNSNDVDIRLSKELNKTFGLGITYIKAGFNSGFAGPVLLRGFVNPWGRKIQS